MARESFSEHAVVEAIDVYENVGKQQGSGRPQNRDAAAGERMHGSNRRGSQGVAGRDGLTRMTWLQQVFGQSVSAGHLAGVLACGYVAGCLTTGYYLVRLRLGLDIREWGSGSVGARNVGRIMGIPGFLFTTAGDFAKGAGAVWLARHFLDDPRLTGLAMLAVVFGHIWPVQLGFRGGKGVATSLGALAVYDFRLGLAFIALAALFALFGRITPAGLVAFALLPAAAKLLERGPLEIIIIAALAGMILFAHRKNLLEEFTHPAALRDADTKPEHPLK